MKKGIIIEGKVAELVLDDVIIYLKDNVFITQADFLQIARRRLNEDL